MWSSRALERLAGDAAADGATVSEQAGAVAAAVRRLADGGHAPEPAPRAPAGPARPDRPVVVAIEDSAANVGLLERIFETIPEVELVTAGNGRDGARLALERRATLVLLDLNLPDGPGERVLRRLRGPNGSPQTKVVVLSAEAAPDPEAQARLLGADDYITKPFDIARLRSVVRRACLPD